jgi:glutamate-1-semialdehyde 2,1-aminomutase
MTSALETYLSRTAESRRLHEQARRVMPGGDTRTSAYWAPYPVFVERGEGCRLWDADGHPYVDFVNNYTSLILGHAHPAVLEAVTRELARGTAYAAPLVPQIALAEMLVDRVPSLETVRFCNSGTEATLFALRAARAFTGRPRFIKIEGGFHGTHDAVEVSVSPDLASAGPAGDPRPVPDSAGLPPHVADDVVIVPFNDVAAAERAFTRHPGEIGALIVEPVPGGLSYIPPAPGYLAGLREVTRKNGALLIFDEIQTLRLSRGGAQELFGVTPDLTAMGKIIGGGFPVGAFGGRRDVMDLFDPNRPGHLHHSGTFNGNRATMVAGQAVLKILDQPQIDRLNALGDRLRAGLSETVRASGIRAQVTGVGSFSSVLLTDKPVTDYRSKAAIPAALQSLLHLHLLNRGVYSMSRGAFSLCAPMTDAEIEACAGAVGDALREMRPDVERQAPHLLA